MFCCIFLCLYICEYFQSEVLRINNTKSNRVWTCRVYRSPSQEISSVVQFFKMPNYPVYGQSGIGMQRNADAGTSPVHE